MNPNLDEVAQDPAVGEVKASIADSHGKTDLSLIVSLSVMLNVESQSHMETTTMIHQVDGEWHKTKVQSNTLSSQRLFPRDVQLLRHGGPLSQLLDGLGASTILRLDVVKDAQIVLNLPSPLKSLERI